MASVGGATLPFPDQLDVEIDPPPRVVTSRLEWDCRAPAAPMTRCTASAFVRTASATRLRPARFRLAEGPPGACIAACRRAPSGTSRLEERTCFQGLSEERAKGIEPSPPAWKAGALPLSYARARSEG